MQDLKTVQLRLAGVAEASKLLVGDSGAAVVRIVLWNRRRIDSKTLLNRLPRHHKHLEWPDPMEARPESRPESRRLPRSLTLGLYVNAGLLAVIAYALLNRGHSPLDSITLNSTAFGQQAPQAIAGGAGFYLMPAQFGSSSWGCYVMDVDAQTLIAYVYDPSNPRTLRLAAARSFAFDRQLRSYNTLPKPEDVEQIIKLEKDNARMPADATTKPTIPEQ